MDFVQTIRNSSHELLVVINDILDLSKIEGGHLEIQSEAFSLRDCIEGSLDLVAERAASKNLELVFQWSEPDMVIVSDQTRLRQIIVNCRFRDILYDGCSYYVAQCCQMLSSKSLKFSFRDRTVNPFQQIYFGGLCIRSS